MRRIREADPALFAASVAFAGAWAFGSAVSVRQNLHGEPLGIRLPITVRHGLLAGWGAGVAAPWPMPLAALVAATTAEQANERRVPGLLCAGIGIGCIVGTLVEPVTRRPGSWGRGVGAAIALNVVAGAALTAAGLRYASRRSRFGPQHS